MNFIFQKFCDFFPHYIVSKNKFYKKTFYIIFCIFRYFITGPFIIKFKEFKFYCYPNKNDYTKYIFSRGEMPDPAEISLLKSYILNQNSIFIDCGANAGFYSIPIASSNPFCKIISFEPSKIEFEKLNRNINLNNLKNIIPEKKAVSNKVQKLLYKESDKTTLNLKNKNNFIFDKSKNNKNYYKITAVSIDSYLKKIKIKKNTKIIIKFDLEGHDLKAIYGAKKTINKYMPLILLEFSKMIINEVSYNKKKFINFIKKNNLQILNLNKKIYTVEMLHDDLLNLDKNHDTIGNFILIKKSELKKIKFFNN